MIIEQWSQDPEFNALPDSEKSAILTGYFDTEMIDDEFKALPIEEQNEIRDEFLRSEGFSATSASTAEPEMDPADDIDEPDDLYEDPMWGTFIAEKGRRTQPIKALHEGTKTAGKAIYTGWAAGNVQYGKGYLNNLHAEMDTSTQGSLPTLTAGEQSHVALLIRKAEKVKGLPLNPLEIGNIRRKDAIEHTKEWVDSVDKSMAWVQEKLANDPKFLESATFFEELLMMTPQVAGQIVSHLIAGPAASMPYMALHIMGGTYENLVNSGVDPRRALNAGIMKALTTAPLESIGIGRFTKFFKPKKELVLKLRDLGKSMGSEWLTEFTQAHPDVIFNIWGKGANESNIDMWNEYLVRFKQTLKDGAKEGLMAALIPGAGGAVMMGKDIVYPTKTPFKSEDELRQYFHDIIDKNESITDEQKAESHRMVEEAEDVLEPNDIEEMINEEKRKLNEVLKVNEDEVTKATETPKEKIQRQAKEKALEILTVPKIQAETNLDDINTLVDFYDKMDESEMNKNHLARQRAAQAQQIKLMEQEEAKKKKTDSGKPEPVQGNKVAEKDVTEEPPKQLKRPQDMTKEEYVTELKEISDKVDKAEKDPDREMTPEESEMNDRSWEEFSRYRGYTEEEIADFARWRELAPPDYPVTYENDTEMYKAMLDAKRTDKDKLEQRQTTTLEEDQVPTRLEKEEGVVNPVEVEEKVKTDWAAKIANDPASKTVWIYRDVGFSKEEIKSGLTESQKKKATSGWVFFNGILTEPTQAIIDELRVRARNNQNRLDGINRQWERYNEIKNEVSNEIAASNLIPPTGQSPVSDKPWIGSYFTREGYYAELGGRSDIQKFTNLNSNDEATVLLELGLQKIEAIEKQLYEGTFKYQFLVDKLLQGSKVGFTIENLNLINFKGTNRETSVTDGNRAELRSSFNKQTGITTSVDIVVFPELIAKDVNPRYTEGSIVHEILHGLYRQHVGNPDSRKARKFFRDIKKIWQTIPAENIAKFKEFAAIYDHRSVIGSKFKEVWDNSSQSQQDLYRAWSGLMSYIDLMYSGRGNQRHWEEVMTYAFSRKEILGQLNQIYSKKPRTSLEKETIWQQLLRVVLDFLPIHADRQTREAKQTIADDLVALNNETINNISIVSQEIIAEQIAEYKSSGELNIQGNQNFPKNSFALRAALIDSDTDRVWTSPLGHWDISGAPSGSLDGFAAVDHSGKVLDYYTRGEALDLVKKDKSVDLAPDQTELMAEDLKYGKHPTSAEPDTSSKKKQLTAGDRAILQARKEARGGKSLAEVNKAKDNQRKKESKEYKKKWGEQSRHDKLDPAKNLATMKPKTLEKEESKIRKEFRLKPNMSESRRRYLNARLDKINLVQQKHAENELKKVEIEHESKVKNINKQSPVKRIKYYKEQYRRLIDKNAPYHEVDMVKQELIQLMGVNEFYAFSGDPLPTIAEPIVQPTRNEKGEIVPTKIAPFTEQHANEKAKETDTTMARNIIEARSVHEKALILLRTKFQKGMEEDTADMMSAIFAQSYTFDLITKEQQRELVEEINILRNVVSNPPSFETTINRNDWERRDPVQDVFNKLSPRRVKFEMYASPNDGFIPSGYLFTITDRNSPAWGASLAIGDLKKETITKKIKEAEAVFGKHKTSQELIVIDDARHVTTGQVKFDRVDDDTTSFIVFNHFIFQNVRATEISFSYTGDTMYGPTYDRKGKAVRGELGDDIKNQYKKGIQTVRSIQRMLFNLFNGEYKANPPDAIYFSGSEDDINKNKNYRNFAERLAKKLNWDIASQELAANPDVEFILANPKRKVLSAEEVTKEQKLMDDSRDNYVYDNSEFINNEDDDIIDLTPYYDEHPTSAEPDTSQSQHDALVDHETQDLEDNPMEMSNPELEAKVKRDETGVYTENWFTRFATFLKGDFREYFREFAYLPRKAYSNVQYKLRQLKKGQALSAEEAAKMLAKNIDSLSKAEFQIFSRMTWLADFYEQVTMNEEARAQGKKPVVEEFPNGMTEAEIKKEAGRYWAAVKANGKIERAWNARLEMWRDLRVHYRDALAEVGFDVTRRLKRSFYFRHQILEILNEEHKKYGNKGTGGKLAVPTRRSHLRKRTGGTAPINLNYIQTDFEVMSQMIYDTKIAETLAAIWKEHGSKEPKEGYVPYKPREDTVFYMANSVPGKLIDNTIAAGLDEFTVKLKDTKPVIALGGKYKDWYLPEEVAKTLDTALEKPRRGPFARFMHNTLRAWKMWQLLSPFRVLKYNARNLSGDVEAMFVGDMKTFLYMKVAAKDLLAWKRKGEISEDLQDWLDRGGTEQTLQSQEFGQLLRDPLFRKHILNPKKNKLDMALWPARKVRAWTDMRESFLRYTAYKRYIKLFNSGKKVTNYAASMPEEVNALQDNRDKAFLMANDLLGAYDRISVTGNYLRDYIAPFWSFQEINMKRTLQFTRNAVKNDDLMMMIGKKLGAKGVVLPLKLGKLVFKLGVLQTCLQAWNQFKWPEEEDALPDEMHRRVHFIFGPTGNDIIYFPRIGILGDLLEWAGVDTVPTDIIDIFSGKKSVKQVVDSYNYGWENGMNAVNKAIQSLGPQFKMPVEIFLQEKLFPNTWNRQPVTDRWRYVAEQLQAEGIYDIVAGKPLKHGHGFEMLFKMGPVYKGDIYRFGWIATQEKVHNYMRKRGLLGSGFVITESGTALYNMGLAHRYGDQKAFNKYLAEYIEAKKKQLKFDFDIMEIIEDQWEKLDPLRKLPEKYHDEFLQTLTEKEEYALGLANTYYQQMRSGMQYRMKK